MAHSAKTSKLIRFISPSETCWIHKWLTSILLVLSNRLKIEKGLSVGFQNWVGLKYNNYFQNNDKQWLLSNFIWIFG